jgi:hypothetical protein
MEGETLMAKSESDKPQLGWGFLFQWMLATTVGMIISGGILVIIMKSLISNGFNPTSIESAMIFGSLTGASLGLMQWLVLRRHTSIAGWWVLSTTLSLTGGEVITWGTLVPSIPSWIGFSLIGILVGGSQWLILKQYSSRAFSWVFASLLGWAAFEELTVRIAKMLPLELRYLAWPMGTILMGAVTGVALIYLLRHPLQKSSDSTQVPQSSQ